MTEPFNFDIDPTAFSREQLEGIVRHQHKVITIFSEKMTAELKKKKSKIFAQLILIGIIVIVSFCVGFTLGTFFEKLLSLLF